MQPNAYSRRGVVDEAEDLEWFAAIMCEVSQLLRASPAAMGNKIRIYDSKYCSKGHVVGRLAFVIMLVSEDRLYGSF